MADDTTMADDSIDKPQYVECLVTPHTCGWGDQNDVIDLLDKNLPYNVLRVDCRDELFIDTTNFLIDDKPQAVLVLDPGLLEPRFGYVWNDILTYILNGGRVIFCGCFLLERTLDELNDFVRSRLCIPWRLGSLHNRQYDDAGAFEMVTNPFFAHTSAINTDLGTVATTQGSVRLEGYLCLENVDPADALYVSSEFAKHPTLVAFMPLVNGWIGFAGLDLMKEEYHHIIFSMCGLKET